MPIGYIMSNNSDNTLYIINSQMSIFIHKFLILLHISKNVTEMYLNGYGFIKSSPNTLLKLSLAS